MECQQPISNDLSRKCAHGSDLGIGGVKDNTQAEAVFMEAEPSGELVTHFDNLHRIEASVIGGFPKGLNKSMESLVGQSQLTYTLPMQNVVCNKGEVGHSETLNGIFSFGATQTPLADITNRVVSQPLKSSKKKWTKLLREVGESDSSSDMETSESRQPEYYLVVLNGVWDVFDQGLLDDSNGDKNHSTERQALRGFDKIDSIKEELEKAYPGVVSCADIVSIALCWKSTERCQGAVTTLTEIPRLDDNITQTLHLFAHRGTHNIGKVDCEFIQKRFSDFKGTRQPDPTIAPDFLPEMRMRFQDSNGTTTQPSSSSMASLELSEFAVGMSRPKKGVLQSMDLKAGGPFYPVSTGRRDSTHISMKDWLIFHDRFLDHLKVHTTLGRLVEFIQKLLSDYKGTGQPD
ncbi:peroxidase 43 [Quercus suber]|uniref:Peroxidase n=1 Tax=Quercus suber TaxID=58331 RepID=A0AAW0LFS3_QUESU